MLYIVDVSWKRTTAWAVRANIDSVRVVGQINVGEAVVTVATPCGTGIRRGIRRWCYSGETGVASVASQRDASGAGTD